MKITIKLLIIFLLSSSTLLGQQKFKELPAKLQDEISRKDFRQARKSYEEAIKDSFPITITPIERIIYDQNDVHFSRANGTSSVSSWGKDVMIPQNLRDRVVEECSNYDFVICTVDSGVDPNHEVYRGDWWLPSSNYTTDKNKHWHGTHVSGIIWQMVEGVIRSSGKSKMKDVQILNSSGSGSFTWAKNMVKTETNIFKIPVENGLGVIFNNSWGYNGNPIQSFESEVKKSIDLGMIWIGSAGNSGKEGPGYPGSSQYFTSVASLDKNLRRSSFSTTNPHVDVSAPGSGINSTIPGNKQAKASGTSMASPFIAGLAALAYGKYGPILQGENMYTYLWSICTDITPEGRDNATGFGIPYLINMLETDPCSVSGIDCNDTPGPPSPPKEDPPKETPDPPSEDPAQSTITYTSTDGHFIRYRIEGQRQWTFLYIPKIRVSRTGNGSSDQVYEEIAEFVNTYFHNRGIVLSKDMGYMDAIYWTGQFLEYVSKNQKLPIQVLHVSGRDEYGRKGEVNVFDRAEYATEYKLNITNSDNFFLEAISNIPEGVELITIKK